MSPENLLNGRLVVMLLAGGVGERLFPITADRSKPAVSFGGNFRIIDFTLANCIMSGIRRVYVLTQYHTLSLNRHLRDRWGFLAREMGEFIEPVPSKMRTPTGLYQGTADAIYRNLDILEEHRPEVVLILSGDHVYRADYKALLEHHIATGADATILSDQVPSAEATRFGVIRCGADGRVEGFVEKPSDPRPYADSSGRCSINLGIYCFNTRFLVQRLVADAKKKTSHDLGKNILPMAVNLGKVQAVPLSRVSPDQTPYWRDVGNIDSFFEASMDLLQDPPAFELRDPRWPPGSRFDEWVPARIISGRDPSEVNLISPGASIERSHLAQCIISPSVRIAEGCQIESAILFNGVQVGRGARLRKVIVEEGVVIPSGITIGFGRNGGQARSPGGITVIAKSHPFGSNDGGPSDGRDGEEAAERPAPKRPRIVETR